MPPGQRGDVFAYLRSTPRVLSRIHACRSLKPGSYSRLMRRLRLSLALLPSPTPIRTQLSGIRISLIAISTRYVARAIVACGLACGLAGCGISGDTKIGEGIVIAPRLKIRSSTAQVALDLAEAKRGDKLEIRRPRSVSRRGEIMDAKVAGETLRTRRC